MQDVITKHNSRRFGAIEDQTVNGAGSLIHSALLVFQWVGPLGHFICTSVCVRWPAAAWA